MFVGVGRLGVELLVGVPVRLAVSLGTIPVSVGDIPVFGVHEAGIIIRITKR